MAMGLKVWNSSGNVLFDNSNRMFTFLGQVDYTWTNFYAAASGSVTNSNFSRGTPFYFINRIPKASVGSDDGMGGVIYLDGYVPVTASFSGTTLNWSANSPNVGYGGSFITNIIRIVYGYL